VFGIGGKVPLKLFDSTPHDGYISIKLFVAALLTLSRGIVQGRYQLVVLIEIAENVVHGMEASD
jgi:hypothetical protein